MIFNAQFFTSVGMREQFLKGDKPEIAVVGKSNVGKSSFINFICNNKNLAKTSKEPGRTRLINYFDINKGEYFLVDLPGYGFARVSDAEKAKWGRLIEEYFQRSENIKNVFLLLDIRHDPTKDDMQMLEYMYHFCIPFTIIATKADKLSKSAAFRRRKELSEYIGVGVDNIYICSSSEKTGGEAIYKRIEEILSAVEH